jgi:hypothetical protein
MIVAFGNYGFVLIRLLRFRVKFLEEIKSILEKLTKKERFSGREMYESTNRTLTNYESTSEMLTSIRRGLGESNYRYVVTGLVRNVFLIELVNDNISSTKMEVRWVQKESRGKKQEKFDQSDPRFCTFEECVEIWSKMISELGTSVRNTDIVNLLRLYQKYSLLPYEIPLDYMNSPVADKSLGSIHCPENIFWMWDEKYQRAIELREILLNPNKNNEADLFSSILKDKLKVKTYLTDRVQTGKHKTNREKRWEVHPESVHFAFRRYCIDIEHRLISQLCHFEGFPPDLFDLLKKEGLITDKGEIFRCPVTLNALSFAEFEKEVRRPFHGKSNFPVGHLNPLKLVTDDPASGHTAENISWFSADGNRIQGSLSLKETRELISQIWRNYEKYGAK